MHGTSGHVAQALRAGVKGYVLKDAAAEELPLLLRAVMRGETYLSPAISKHVVDAYLHRDGTVRLSAPEPSATDGLTPRHPKPLQLVAAPNSPQHSPHLPTLSV